MGNDPDIQRNMALAMAAGKKHAVVALPWYRFLLFWHYGICHPVRMTIAVVAFFAFWLALTLSALGVGRIGRRLLILAVIVLVLFGSSVLTSVHQESAVRSASGSSASGPVPHTQQLDAGRTP